MRRLSIIINAYNEEENIGKLLSRLLRIIDLNDEIVVVASGCTDNTIPIVREFSDKDSRVRLIIEKERRGKASSINKALKHARGKYIAFIPADVIPSRNFFNRILRYFNDEKIGVVGGRPVPVNPKNGVINLIVHFIWDLHDQTLSYLNDLNRLSHISGEGFIIRRGIVNSIPDDVVNDDAYIAKLAKRRGFEIKYNGEAKIYIKGPSKVREFIIQRRRILFGHYQVKEKLGSYPTVFEFISASNPLLALKILIKTLGRNLKYLLVLPPLIVIELILHLMVKYDKFIGRDYTLWEQVKSTKKLI